ncbi:para-aminobenzoic acid synthetase [Infundibulicybe gibba]|nr:para-aminobenzoic acid synthetase [Infundibulicybe gibba]
MVPEHPRLLLVDSYDSFAFNLAALCRKSIPGCIFDIQQLQPYLGPGPDIGVIKDLWMVEDADLLPIFGVCFGLQSLGVEFGARIKRLRVVKHGQVSKVDHTGVELYDGVDKVMAVRYHSLHIEVPEDSVIEPMAWTDDGEENGKVIMAVKHKNRPFWGVQYHPESVCTDGGGLEVLLNFWKLAHSWSKEHNRVVKAWDSAAVQMFGEAWPHLQIHAPAAPLPKSQPLVTTAILDIPDLPVHLVCETLGVRDEKSPFILLESAARPGRFSIIASLMESSLQILHFANEKSVILTRGNESVSESLGSSDIWTWLASFMRTKKATGGLAEIPFWGGLVGNLSYEIGVQSLDVPLIHRDSPTALPRHPDVNLIFVERSVVLDVIDHKVYVQSVLPNDDAWIAEMSSKLVETHKQMLASEQPYAKTPKQLMPNSSATVTLPEKDKYISSIQRAKDFLFSGDSYELCLTAQTHIAVSGCYPEHEGDSTSWARYKYLQAKNPAPHSAYIRLHPSTFLSSSPERFLSFSRPPNSLCQLRPIKGTVRKAPGVTRATAEKALAGSVKEVAENLMIVDLIRHDLHAIVGDDVQTVWQLVSVIEGKLADGAGAEIDPYGEVGWNVLKTSLPPGSMTGAPKKRSVDLLQHIEGEERGLYSGVFGYWCVSGGGDWSVTIRSCCKHDPPAGQTQPSDENFGTEDWVLGAGGAITALSDPEAEWEEMVTKLQSVLGAFGISAYN